MAKVLDRFFHAKHPILAAFVFLLLGLGNAYEAIFIHPDNSMRWLDWTFAIIGFLGFLALLLQGLSRRSSNIREE